MPRKLTIETIYPLALEANVSCSLIPLHKNSSVILITVGKVLRRDVDKYIGYVLKEDNQDAAEPLQPAMDYSLELKHLLCNASLRIIGRML